MVAEWRSVQAEVAAVTASLEQRLRASARRASSSQQSAHLQQRRSSGSPSAAAGVSRRCRRRSADETGCDWTSAKAASAGAGNACAAWSAAALVIAGYPSLAAAGATTTAAAEHTTANLRRVLSEGRGAARRAAVLRHLESPAALLPALEPQPHPHGVAPALGAQLASFYVRCAAALHGDGDGDDDAGRILPALCGVGRRYLRCGSGRRSRRPDAASVAAEAAAAAAAAPPQPWEARAVAAVRSVPADADAAAAAADGAAAGCGRPSVAWATVNPAAAATETCLVSAATLDAPSAHRSLLRCCPPASTSTSAASAERGVLAQSPYPPHVLAASTAGGVVRLGASSSQVAAAASAACAPQLTEVFCSHRGAAVAVETCCDSDGLPEDRLVAVSGLGGSGGGSLRVSPILPEAGADGAHTRSFVGWPALSFDADRIAWVEWGAAAAASAPSAFARAAARHAHRDGSRLMCARYDPARGAVEAAAAVHVDGSDAACAHSPAFLHGGGLVYVADRGCEGSRLFLHEPKGEAEAAAAAPTPLLYLGELRRSAAARGEQALRVLPGGSDAVCVVARFDDTDTVVFYDVRTRAVRAACRQAALLGFTRIRCLEAVGAASCAFAAAGPARLPHVLLYNSTTGALRVVSAGGSDLAPQRLAAAGVRLSERVTVFLPPRRPEEEEDNDDDVDVDGGEQRRRRRSSGGGVPLLLWCHSGYFGEEEEGGADGCYSGETQLFAAHGYAVVHCRLSGGLDGSRERRRRRQAEGGGGPWLSDGASELQACIREVEACGVEVDHYHIAAKGKSLDGLVALAATAGRASLVRAAVVASCPAPAEAAAALKYLVPPSCGGGHEGAKGTGGGGDDRGSGGSSLLEPGALRAPVHFTHGAEDTTACVGGVRAFVDGLGDAPTYHARVVLRVVEGSAAHPVSWVDSAEAELDFLEEVLWEE